MDISTDAHHIHLFWVDGQLVGWSNGENRQVFEQIVAQAKEHIRKVYGDPYIISSVDTEEEVTIELCTKSKSSLPLKDPLKVRCKIEMKRVGRIAQIKQRPKKE